MSVVDVYQTIKKYIIDKIYISKNVNSIYL